MVRRLIACALVVPDALFLLGIAIPESILLRADEVIR